MSLFLHLYPEISLSIYISSHVFVRRRRRSLSPSQTPFQVMFLTTVYISINLSVPTYISSHISVRRRGCFPSCVISFFLHLYTYVSISIHKSIHVSVRRPGCCPTPSLHPFQVLSNYIPIPISVSVSQIVSLLGVGGVVYLESCLYFYISTSTFELYTYACISIGISSHVSVRRRGYFLS